MVNTDFWAKLERIKQDPQRSKDFLICDAKDGDMGFGMVAPGPQRDADGKPTGRFKPRTAHLDQIRGLIRQGVLDLMLTSVSTLEILVNEGAYEGSKVGRAIRANDTTDIWNARHGVYPKQPSLPHRSAVIEHAMYGKLDVPPGTPPTLTDLGLYSVTFMNDSRLDKEAGEQYRAFRIEAERLGFRHFLEVFNPNVGNDKLSRAEAGEFVNDNIARVIAAVPQTARPQFLKIAYNGPKALEELANYDQTVIIGILGGGAGTTRDTFELLARSQKYGARLVLFGRKINNAEDPQALVQQMRRIVRDEATPADAVKAYHDALAKGGHRPLRDIKADSEVTEDVLRD